MKKRNPNFLEKISIFLIVDIHQNNISPYLNKNGGKCRFYPSCANYGLLALEKYGFIKGWYKTIKRILRCVPNNCGRCVDPP